MKYLPIFSIFGLMIFTSCNPKFYTPNTQNVPLISEKGETNLTVVGNPNQVEFQGAYGITDKIAIQANGGLFIPSDLENGNGGSGKFLEVGGGYYKKLDESFVLEVYGIAGFGTMENHFPTATFGSSTIDNDISANVFRFGIQPNIGYKSKYFAAAISSRFVNLNYSNIKGGLIFASVSQADYLKDNSSNFLVEPALTLRGGFEKLKLQLQFGYSFNLSNSDFMQDKSQFTIGLNYQFK